MNWHDHFHPGRRPDSLHPSYLLAIRVLDPLAAVASAYPGAVLSGSPASTVASKHRPRQRPLASQAGLGAPAGIIDHGSRRVLVLQRLPRKCALTVLGNLMLTMARYGVPAVICSDNEVMFTSKLWNTVFASLGIRHRRSRPRCPWDNGVIERLFGTLKPLLRQTRITSPKCLQQVLNEFTGFYNHVRRHRTLGGRTPMEVWQGKSLAEVQAHGHSGHWVQALDGLLVGFHWRC